MIDIFNTPDAMAHAAAALFVRSARQAVHARGQFAVALSGGHTPAPTYELLSSEPYRDQIPWHAVHVFWGDERCVPSDDPQSNQRMARRAFLDDVPIPPEHIHPIDGTVLPEDAAQKYESELREFAHENVGFLDVALLGIGDDGHTASLFPGASILEGSERWALPVAATESRLARVTLTPQVLNHARQIVFLVSGAGKADVLRRIVAQEGSAEDLPALRIRPLGGGEVWWLVDRAAAADLSGR